MAMTAECGDCACFFKDRCYRKNLHKRVDDTRCKDFSLKCIKCDQKIFEHHCVHHGCIYTQKAVNLVGATKVLEYLRIETLGKHDE